MSWDQIRAGLGTTLILWVGAIVIAIVIGALVCGLRMHRNTLVRRTTTVIIAIVRGIPPLVWVFLIFFSVTIGGQQLGSILAATIALGIVGSAYLAEIYRSGLEGVPPGLLEAANALGIPKRTVLIRIRVRLAVPMILAATSAYAINLLKDTALASLIGAQELTFLASYDVKNGASGLRVFLFLGFIYLVASVPIGILARYFTTRAQASLAGAR